jgi:hypothetical protein
MKYYIAGVILLFCQSLAQANISVSKQRLFLDLNQRTTEFKVRNASVVEQNCNIDFNHYKYNESGALSAYANASFIPENSASKLVRYSPKRFTLLGGASQKMRLNLRRHSDTIAQEYRTHIVVACSPKPKVSKEKLTGEYASVTIDAQLSFNIPLVARPTRLTAQVSLENITKVSNKLLLDITRSGNRSVYGKLNIFDEENELLTSSNSFSVYHETTSKSLSIDLPTFDGSTLRVEFVEDILKSGNIITSTIYNVK